MKNATDVQAMLPRLKAGKERNEMRWLEAGKRDGAGWAKQADYADLKEWANTAGALLTRDVIWNTFCFPDNLEDDLRDLHAGKRGPAFDHASYAEGWLTAVLEVWNAVEPHL